MRFYNRYNIEKDLLKYIIVGALSTSLDALIFYTLTNKYFWDFKLALFFSYSIGVILNFWLCYFFIFSSEIVWWKSWFRHNSFSLLVLVVQQLLMIIIVSFFKFNYLLISRIVVSGLTFLINFVFIKNFAFSKRLKN